MKSRYVHGYDRRENQRLNDQAETLVDLFHGDTRFPPGSRVLEAGCGVGAQTTALAGNSPEAQILSIDISGESLARAREKVRAEGITNVSFQQGDIFSLDFEEESFDHIFVCFVLEHLPDPKAALSILKRHLKTGGSITVIEGDHGSTYFHPDSVEAHRAIQSLVDLQRKAGGNANIGRELYPLLTEAGFAGVRVSPRMVYVDASRPEYVEGFTRLTFTAMIEGVREEAIASGLIDRETFEKGVAGLHRTTERDGVFCYTFFKAVAEK